MSKAVLIGSVSLLVLLLIGVGVVLYLQSQQSKTPSPNPSGTPPSGSPPSGSPPSGTPSPVGCTTNAGCPVATPICVIPSGDTKGACKECGSTADCGVNKKCARGKCIDELKCYYNEDCTAAGKTKCLLPSGGTLGTTLGTCNECNSNSDCASGKVCYNGVCTLIADVPPISCKSNTDCANDPKGQTKCLIPNGNLTGTCKTCAKDTDCPNPAAKRCSPDGNCYACLDDSQCVPGQVCQNPGTALAVCVKKGCTSNSDCSSGQICAYPGTTFAQCASLCTNKSECVETGKKNCWGVEGGAITQYKFKPGGPNYCVGNGPQKCCWNRSIQRCGAGANGDCDGGGEGCINSGDNTAQYGKFTCDVCENQGKIYDTASYSCVSPYTMVDNYVTNGEDLRQTRANSADECAQQCLDAGDCTNFAFKKSTKTCWQKRPLAPDNDYDMFYKHGNGVFTKAANLRTTSHDLDRGSANSSQCAAKCVEYGNSCYGYMIQKSNPDSCWIKGQFPSNDHASGNIRKNF